ncbi:dnaJ homolog subfamily C member 28 [Pelobates cultripes]|uniref:DnaJ homolog subfamily C member 28 n=1 Tax=Pelobates cultripes TaxID=61616 RepID=A0AAD1VK66_PELCU|nr:dnaJ homolog subfamily C member 28 [Pelobates cultripes]
MKLLEILLDQNSKYSFCAPVIFYRILCQRYGLRLHSTFNKKRSIKDCCRVLNVPEDCSAEEVRHSYRNLAKKYHPDSGSITADSNKFIQIDEAYRDLLAHLSKETRKGENLDDDDDDSATNFKIPQHRHYLSYEGVGYGTPSQRQKQYIQFRVDRASEHVLDFRKQKLERQSAENTMIAKDVKQNPMTHNLNRILIDNGYQPEWIVLQKEIRESIEKLRSEALASRKKLGDPMTNATSEQWDEICEHLKEDISQLNKKINDFNLVVPLLNRQMVHFNADKEISHVEQAYLSLKENEQKTLREKKAEDQLDDKQFNLKQTLMSLVKQFKML